ncbi:MAG: ABC transporter ATP-binding protein, partial [Gammaproteobacteria bacterium]|nr:ABC transporter ATP-binding protein [Gammaproteobacteria bacterium]
ACLLGASGCGKTTLLRCVAGFEEPDSGRIEFAGVVFSEPGKILPPHQRAVGMVFQDHALFPHLNVAQNAGFALHQWDRPARQRRVEEVLNLVGMSTLSQRYPHQLSGGQQQRAALARALANQPQLLLLDEPFASLDRDLRYRLAQEVAGILKECGTMALWVTHDQKEAMMVADKIGIMHAGRIEQWDTPAGLFHRPVTEYVAAFMADCRFLTGTIGANGEVVTALGQVRQLSGVNLPAGTPVNVPVRSDQVHIGEGINATVSAVRFQGAESECEVELGGGEKLLVRIPSRHDLKVADQLRISWQETRMPAFEKEVNSK